MPAYCWKAHKFRIGSTDWLVANHISDEKSASSNAYFLPYAGINQPTIMMAVTASAHCIRTLQQFL
jgi:hypothetical protein